MCALERSQILQEDEIRAVYLPSPPLIFLRRRSQAFNPFPQQLLFIRDLVFQLLAGLSVSRYSGALLQQDVGQLL